jgi:hypothetical protein
LISAQVYVGVKLNNFDWGPPSDFEGDRGRERRRTKTAQILLVCAGVLFTNISAWLARELVRELTRDDGLYLPEVHAHPLVYDATLSRHWCDLCGTPIRRGGAWRCELLRGNQIDCVCAMASQDNPTQVSSATSTSACRAPRAPTRPPSASTF